MKTLYIFLVLSFLSCNILFAQNVGIGTATPNSNALLHVDLGLSTSKGILVTGTYDASASTVPDLGPGSRLMFYPGKGAFRAGYVGGTHWNDINVGTFSSAMGANTRAIGHSSTALGFSSTASEYASTAIGYIAAASGMYSMALGSNVTASGTHSTAMGIYTTAGGNSSTALGYFNIARGFGSTVLGMYNDPILGDDQSANATFQTPLFIIGNGNNTQDRNNAMVVRRTGNVGIGSSASISSAILDVSSTTQGFLPPRMTSAQRAAIASPVAGLIVYETDSKLLYQHDGTNWIKMLNSSFWNSSATRAWVYNTTDSIGIGTSAPAEKLHISNGQLRLSRTASFENNVLFNMPAATLASEHEGLKLQVGGTDKAFIGYSSNSVSPSVLRLSGNGLFANDLTISSTGLVGMGTNDPQEKLHVVGNALLNASSATLQLQSGGVDKGFIQLSGDDIRVGTYSTNTNGKFFVRTNGANQLEIDGTLGINIMKLYAAGAHRASLTTSTNDNLTINTVNANSQLQLNNEVYIDITNSKTGFGTPNPDEKVHVSGGNLKITSGKLLNSTTGDFDMMPLCYGRINANGSIYTATPNVSVTRTSAGTYEITCSGITASSVINVTVYGSTRFIGSGEYVSAGKMKVQVENIKEVIDDPSGFHANDDKTFYFVIYN